MNWKRAVKAIVQVAKKRAETKEEQEAVMEEKLSQNEAENAKRLKFLKEAIEKLPEGKTVIVIRDNYMPIYEGSKEIFFEKLQERKKNPDEGFNALYYSYIMIWVAFNKEISKENLKKISERLYLFEKSEVSYY